MTLKIKLLISCILLLGLNAYAQNLSVEEKGVFDDIAYITGPTGKPTIRKWVMPIRYQVKGEKTEAIIKEVDGIFNQLAELTALDIKSATNDSEANFIIEIGKEDMSKNMNTPGGGTMKYMGNTDHKNNENSEIISVNNLYIVTGNKTKGDVRYDLVRLILKSMGFFKRSEILPYSVFYSRTNNALKISSSDAKIIKVFYAKEIKPGMTKDEVNHIFGIN
jgi:hypothetical protein